MDGWIKLHRSSLNHWLYAEIRPLTKREAWETILLSVNYDYTRTLIRGKLYECAPGQSLLSLENWAKKFVWSVQQVRTFFKLLENDQMITTEGMQYTTRLTVCNWAIYQGYATDEQQTKQQTDNRPITTTKEREELYNSLKEKSKKENFCDESHETQPDTETPNPTPVAPPPSPAKPAKKTRQQPEELLFPFESDEFKRIWNIWMQQPKQKKKPMSAHQLTLDKLSKYNEQFAIELIDKAAQGGYQGCVFSSTQGDYEAWLRNQGTGTMPSQRQQSVNQQTGNQKTFDYYDRIAKGAIQQLSGDLNTGDLND